MDSVFEIQMSEYGRFPVWCVQNTLVSRSECFVLQQAAWRWVSEIDYKGKMRPDDFVEQTVLRCIDSSMG